MTNSETSRTDDGLTGETNSQESHQVSIEPGGTDLPEGANNFQHALQKSREREKEMAKRAEELEARLRAFQEKEKAQKLESLSDAERYKAMAEEETQKRAKLELQLVVNNAIADKKLPAGIKALLSKSPWAIPDVQDELGDSFTWDEAIESVRRHLPAYVESLSVSDEAPDLRKEEDLDKKVDSERAADSGVIKEHLYTKSEVAELSKNPSEYEKHREKILRQMSKYGGVLPM